jgi:hypothetical protein
MFMLDTAGIDQIAAKPAIQQELGGAMKLSAIAAFAVIMAAPAAQAAANSPAPAGKAPTPAAPAPVANAADYAVPVEHLTLGKGKGGFMNINFATAGFNFSTNTYLKDISGPFAVTVMGSDKTREAVIVDYRITKDGIPHDRGTCSVVAKVSAGLWNSTRNGLYTCERKPEGTGPADFLLEAQLPNLPPRSSAMIQLSKDDPDVFKVLKARMRYDGKVYEAVPTAIDPNMAARGFRAAQGWLVTQDGKPVGRIDFPSRAKAFSDMGGSYDRKSVVVAPVQASDGRDAVVVFIAHLLVLPEANSPLYQER